MFPTAEPIILLEIPRSLLAVGSLTTHFAEAAIDVEGMVW